MSAVPTRKNTNPANNAFRINNSLKTYENPRLERRGFSYLEEYCYFAYNNPYRGHGLVVEAPMAIGEMRVHMYYIYILQSLKNGGYYIGSTGDVFRRLDEHNAGKTKSLKYLRPLSLVFKQAFNSEVDARKVERHLKKMKNKNIIESIIKDGAIKSAT